MGKRKKLHESRVDLGKHAEEIAAEYLKHKGYEILERNFRWSGGEIDIIAKEGDDIVFIEVRSLSSNKLDPVETVSPLKLERLLRTAHYYLCTKGIYGEVNCRFDFLGVRFSSEKPLIEHMKDAIGFA